jgi:hypothetical protein
MDAGVRLTGPGECACSFPFLDDVNMNMIPSMVRPTTGGTIKVEKTPTRRTRRRVEGRDVAETAAGDGKRSEEKLDVYFPIYFSIYFSMYFSMYFSICGVVTEERGERGEGRGEMGGGRWEVGKGDGRWETEMGEGGRCFGVVGNLTRK